MALDAIFMIVQTLLAYAVTCLAACRMLVLAAFMIFVRSVPSPFAVPGRRIGSSCLCIGACWQQVYGARIDNLHLPASKTAWAKLAEQYGRDGYHLLEAVHARDAPGWLRELPAVVPAPPVPGLGAPWATRPTRRRRTAPTCAAVGSRPSSRSRTGPRTGSSR